LLATNGPAARDKGWLSSVDEFRVLEFDDNRIILSKVAIANPSGTQSKIGNVRPCLPRRPIRKLPKIAALETFQLEALGLVSNTLNLNRLLFVPTNYAGNLW